MDQVAFQALTGVVTTILLAVIGYINRKSDRAIEEATATRNALTEQLSELAIKIVGDYPNEVRVRQLLADQLSPLRIELRNMHRDMDHIRRGMETITGRQIPRHRSDDDT